MVTVAEAQIQVKEAKAGLKTGESEAQKRASEIKSARTQAQQRFQKQSRVGKISSQVSLAGQVGRGAVRGEIKRRRSVARQELRTTRGRISGAERDLRAFRKELTARGTEIKGVESQIVSAQAQQAQQAAEQVAIQQDIKTAQKLVRKGIFDPFAPPRVKKFVREIQAGQVPLQPTKTEIALQMSLPVGFRKLPPTEIVAGLPGAKIFAGQSLIPQGRILPPVSIQPIERITFGQPERFAESFAAATGATSFTLAVPIRREEGRIRVQDFNFLFEDGRLVRTRPTGTALLTEEQFLAADLRRRGKAPGFTFGTTAQFQTLAPTPTPFALPIQEGGGRVFLRPSEFREVTGRQISIPSAAFVSPEAVSPIGAVQAFGIPAPIVEAFTGREFERGRAIIAIRGDPTFVEGTPEFQVEVRRRTQQQLLGTQLQSALFFSFAGVRSPVGRIRIPTRRVREPSFVEFQQPIIARGRQDVFSAFEITREISPPTIVGTPSGGLIGGIVKPARVEITRTPFGTIGDLPTVTLTTRGGRIGRLDILSGTVRPTGVQELGSLPRRQQFLFQRFAEITTQGRPVALARIPRVLREDLEFGLGDLRSLKVGRIDIGTRPTTLDLFPPRQAGRRITRFETLGQFERVGVRDQFDIFRGQVLFKEVTRPFARATGRTPRLRGTIIRIREPVVIGEDLGVQIFRPSGGARTPLDVTFATQQVSIPKVPIPPRPRRVRARVTAPTRTGITISPLPGVSLRGIESFSIGLPPPPRQVSLGRVAPLTQFDAGRQFSLLGQRIDTSFRFQQRQLPIQREISSLRLEDVQLEKQIFGQRQISRQAQELVFRFQQRQVTPQALRVPRPTKGRAAPRPPRQPRPPRVPPIDLPDFSFPTRRKPITKKKKKLKRRRQVIRPSLTGIVTEGVGLPETTFIGGIDVGVLPRFLRGLPI